MTLAEAIAECRALVREHDIHDAELQGGPVPKFTVCPSLGYDPRYQLPPGIRTFGAGFAAAGIGRDIDTGREWA